MRSFDIIFIHPPRVIRPYSRMNSKLIRGSYLFIPMGVFALADYLEREGYAVQIINFPLEQYLDQNWSLENYLKTIDFKVVGIDFHWIHNAFGAIETAKIVKKVNPNAKVILGGLSASYYHDQILKYYSCIDSVIRGEAEIPLFKFMQSLKNNQEMDNIPNLTYRDSNNHIKINSLTYCAKNLDDLHFTNVKLLKNERQYLEQSRNLMGISLNLPVAKGCPFNCPFCAGGQRAQQKYTGRTKVIVRNPEKIVEDIRSIKDNYNIPSVFFGHGTYPARLKYWKNLFSLIRKEQIDISADLEIWRLPFPKEMWREFYKTFRRRFSSISISPRTTSTRVQKKIAQVCDPTFQFSNNQINDLIKNANNYRLVLRIWLSIGYPFQNLLDIIKDYYFGFKCFLKYGPSKIKPITIMSETYHIFPGSPAYESPEKFKINLKFNSFPEIVNIFKRTNPSFFYNVINYDSEHFSSTTIKNINTFFFILNSPLFLTTGSNLP